MPALSTEVNLFLKRVTDALRSGSGYSSARLTLGSANSSVLLVANNPGANGNNITVQVTVPSGTSALTVTSTGNAITIALDVSSGTPQTANNTATKIVAAVNAAAGPAALVTAYVPQNTTGASSLSAASGPTALAGGKGGGATQQNIDTYPLNFLAAQDLATALELMQAALGSGSLTATGGTSTTVQYKPAAFVQNSLIGNTVTFGASTTTVALRNKTFTIKDNTHQVLTLIGLNATPVNGDTFTINGAMLAKNITELRQGKGLGDAPAGSVYGTWRQAIDAVDKVVQALGYAVATGTITQAGQPNNTGTVTIDSKVYTFQTTLTNVDGNVHIGTTAANSLLNLFGAITLQNGESTGAGTDYATAMTLHPTVTAPTPTATVLTLKAKAAGTAGNSIATTVTATNYTAQQATLAGGAAAGAVTERVMASLKTAAGSSNTVLVIDTTLIGSRKMRVDQFVGMKVTVGSDTSLVLGNDESTITLRKALSSAPGAATTVSVTLADRREGGSPVKPLQVHPGGQPGNAQQLAVDLLAAKAAVVAFVTPT